MHCLVLSSASKTVSREGGDLELKAMANGDPMKNFSFDLT